METIIKRASKFSVGGFVKAQGVFLAFLLLFLIASFMYEDFLSVYNLTNILRQVSMIGLVALGMTFVILVGGIDLSVGSVVAVAGVIAASVSGGSVLITILLPVAAGTVIGLINGLVITRMKVMPFIATLATMMGARGIAYIVTDAQSVSVESSSAFSKLARGFVLGIPIPALIFVFAVLISILVARYTGLGRYIFAVGGNEEAAKMMGLNVNRVKIAAYTISGMFAGLAGVILTSRLGAGQPVAAEGWEMTAIAGVVIGGTLLTGGVGKFSGTFFGVLIIGIITNMFNMQGNINTWWQNVIMGAVLLTVVVLQSQSAKKKKA
jgi:ribose/xylose/arabinose/galactoside ABC-type transport system permease subunit